jgi:hypothetical protein
MGAQSPGLGARPPHLSLTVVFAHWCVATQHNPGRSVSIPSHPLSRGPGWSSTWQKRKGSLPPGGTRIRSGQKRAGQNTHTVSGPASSYRTGQLVWSDAAATGRPPTDQNSTSGLLVALNTHCMPSRSRFLFLGLPRLDTPILSSTVNRSTANQAGSPPPTGGRALPDLSDTPT